jgi:hypothetical protein
MNMNRDTDKDTVTDTNIGRGTGTDMGHELSNTELQYVQSNQNFFFYGEQLQKQITVEKFAQL